MKTVFPVVDSHTSKGLFFLLFAFTDAWKNTRQ